MSTTTRSPRTPVQFAQTMLLGLAMALGIAAVGDPQASWAGFALAAAYAESRPGGTCRALFGRRSRG